MVPEDAQAPKEELLVVTRHDARNSEVDELFVNEESLKKSMSKGRVVARSAAKELPGRYYWSLPFLEIPRPQYYRNRIWLAVASHSPPFGVPDAESSSSFRGRRRRRHHHANNP